LATAIVAVIHTFYSGFSPVFPIVIIDSFMGYCKTRGITGLNAAFKNGTAKLYNNTTEMFAEWDKEDDD